MRMKLDPPRAAGPIRIGMTMAEAEAALEEPPGLVQVQRIPRGLPGGPPVHALFADYQNGLSIEVSPEGDAARVLSVECWRPWRLGAVAFPCLGVDVLNEPARDVVAHLRSRAALELENDEDDPETLVAPQLLLALRRTHIPDEEEAAEEPERRCFASALVAAPAYYDHI